MKVNCVQTFVAFIYLDLRARTICISSSEAKMKTIAANFALQYVATSTWIGFFFFPLLSFVLFELDLIMCL